LIVNISTSKDKKMFLVTSYHEKKFQSNFYLYNLTLSFKNKDKKEPERTLFCLKKESLDEAFFFYFFAA